jgi:NAD(P)-dependent dehydrogenase (short-subunit alcohol dehydrogenase family)
VTSIDREAERHVVHVADLDDEEAAELAAAAQAPGVTELIDPDQVYVSLWSHAGCLAHPSSCSPSRAMVDEFARPNLQSAMFAAGRLSDPADVEAFADAARAQFAGPVNVVFALLGHEG